MYYYVLEDEKKHNHDHIWRCFRNSPPPEKLIVMAERAALFTWDDKSMNHLFQHCSAFAVCPRGTRFHLAHPPTLLVCPPAKKKKKEREESFRPKAKRLCAGVMIVLSLSLRRKLVFLYLFGWACALSSGSVFIQFNVHVWRVYLDIKVDLCVCMCIHSPESSPLPCFLS